MSDGRDDDPVEPADPAAAEEPAAEGVEGPDEPPADGIVEETEPAPAPEAKETAPEEPTADAPAAAGAAATATAKAKSGPPPRPSKNARKTAAPPRPKTPKGSRKARRRRFGAVEATFVVLLLLLVARIVTLAVDDAKASSWAWISLAAVAGLFVWSFLALLDKRGRLARFRGRGLGALAFVLALAAFSITTVVVNDAEPELGLDLQGGFSVVLSAKGDPAGDSIDQAMEIIRNRIDALGVAEPEVTRQGDNVVVDLPGIEDRQRAQEILGETARLEFRPVLQQNLPYDAEAAAAGEDPCAAGLTPEETTTDTMAPVDGSTTTAPADGSTTVPADGSTTVPADGSTTTEATATTSAADEEGAARPAPAGPATPVDGDYAAPPLGRQDGSTTTAPEASTTTAAEGETTTTAAEGETTTTAAEGETTTTVAGETTTTAPGTTTPEEASDPAAEAANTITIPYRPVADEPPVACTQVGPAGIEGGALSKAQAQLGGQTGSTWVVGVTVKGSQRGQANELINTCASAGTGCPQQGVNDQGQPVGAMAIVLDDEVISAPLVQAPNLADQEFVISGGGEDGGFPESEAKDLALKLRYGALPVEFTRSAERQVSPTLGEDSLQAGILAGIIGLLAVAIYLIIYYRALGLVVVAGLAVWSALMYGTICWFSATRGLTLSLAGVVGIVVSLGTTVDSYVVYFERLKDEVRAGKSVRASTEKGFTKAFNTIVTADVASLLGAALLWWLTVGAVRGFAFFLGLSVVLDLIVAYFFTRPIVSLLARSDFFVRNPVFGVARGLGRSGGDDDASSRATGRTKAGASS